MEQAVLDRLRRWIVCFALVEFDLDTGVRFSRFPLISYNLLTLSLVFFYKRSLLPQPLLTSLYPPPPPSLPLPPSLQQNIAFSSLPEGDLPTAGAHAYTWRIPIPLDSKGKEQEVAEVEGEGDGDGDEWRKGDGCLHGFVWFVQEKVSSQLSASLGDRLQLRGWTTIKTKADHRRAAIQTEPCGSPRLFSTLSGARTSFPSHHITIAFNSLMIPAPLPPSFTAWRFASNRSPTFPPSPVFSLLF